MINKGFKQDKNILIKTLIYRSLHRGCKETDILLGLFAQSKINSFSELDLEMYSQFIVEDDASIYDWILQKSPEPKKYITLIENIREFHNL